jgi:Nucleotide-diphospho-sugar transferase
MKMNAALFFLTLGITLQHQLLRYQVQAARTLDTNSHDTNLNVEITGAITPTDNRFSNTNSGRDLQSSSLYSRGYAWYPPQTKVPQDLILANSSLLTTLDKVALPDPSGKTRGTIIFTTLRFGDGDQTETMEMINSFCYWLYSSRLLNHTMLITTDEATWTEVAALGHPIFLDRVFPRREAYIDAVLPQGTYNREFDVQKHWWGMRLVELRYRVVYMDSDNFVLQSGFLDPFEEPYDVQALSDWFEAELWPVGSAVEKSCGLYFTVKNEGIARGAMLQEGWHVPNNKEKLETANPCQSTGLWYLQPTDVTVAFMRAVVNRIAFHAVWQWDQTAFNEIIMPYTWGMGDQPPLKYRLLPVSKFLNIPVMMERQKKGLTNAEIIVLHAGGLHGSEKKAAFLERKIYRPSFHTPRNESVFSEIIAAAIVSTDFTSGGTNTVVQAADATDSNLTTPSHLIINNGALHHWQPTDEHTFWMVLYVILVAMALGAALVLCCGAGNGLGGRKALGGLRRQGSTTSSKRRHAGERSGNTSGSGNIGGSNGNNNKV